ncbi:MAG: protease pro-enzyme activation domain-containing protein [Bryobacteraceae bacterium]
MTTKRTLAICLSGALLLTIPWAPVHAQRADRLPFGIDNRARVNLAGYRNPRIAGLTSDGPVEDSMPVNGITLHFKPSASQTAALDQLLEQQQDPESPEYHRWLTPEQFGERFGLSGTDFARVREWIETQGFQVDAASRSRAWIRFSGTALDVRHAFGTDLHRFRRDGEVHYANVADPSLPADLASVVMALRGLDDFGLESSPKPRPEATTNQGHALVPLDLAVIYNITPLFEKGVNGAGQKIAVAGQSQIKLGDIQSFRTKFGLPKNDPRIVLVPGSPDPGVTGAQGEAVLDVEWAGAAAPLASVTYVYAKDALTAAIYTIDQNLAPVLSFSFGACETAVAQLPGAVDLFQSAAKQANAQGITWVAGSGDSGPSACEPHSTATAGRTVAVGLPASLPEVTAVGGTMFSEGNGNYWNTSDGPGLSTARSYIPESAWNDTVGEKALAASGGGASALFKRPAWQTGSGVPSDNARHIPDVAFTASWLHDPYLVIMNGEFAFSGGTSASAPFFAGVLALLNQYVVGTGAQAKPGLGNVNPRLYELAQSTPSIFHDITSGDTVIPCQTGAGGCTSGRWGWKAAPGYDHATGLGSIDVKNLVENWAASQSNPGSVATTLALTASPGSIAANSSAVLTATVKATGGASAPTGTVTFSLGGASLGTATLSGSAGVAAAVFSVSGSKLSPGSNTITASYAGNSRFGASKGTATVTLSGGSNSGPAVTVSIEPSPVYQETAEDGSAVWRFAIVVSDNGGSAHKIFGLLIDNDDYSDYIGSFFGGDQLPANGSLTAKLSATDMKVPLDHVFTVGGVDAKGQRWVKSASVSFRGPKGAGGAAMELTSTPSVVVKIGRGDANCSPDYPYFQKLNLKELAGNDVKLTKFLAGGFDYTEQIGDWFGSAKLPASGSLQAQLCWQLETVPTTLDYLMEGVDATGKTVQATLQVDFKSFDQKSGEPLPGALRGKFIPMRQSSRLPVLPVQPMQTPGAAGSKPSGPANAMSRAVVSSR